MMSRRIRTMAGRDGCGWSLALDRLGKHTWGKDLYMGCYVSVRGLPCAVFVYWVVHYKSLGKIFELASGSTIDIDS